VAAISCIVPNTMRLGAGGGDKQIAKQQGPIPEPAYALELHEGGRLNWLKGSSDLGRFLPDMRSSRTIQVTSRLSKPMKNVKILSSCGCTKATFNKQSLDSGETGEISFTYDSTGRHGKNKIHLNLVSDTSDIPFYPLEVYCTIVDGPSSLYVSIVPHFINVDEVWSPTLENEYLLDVVTIDKRIDLPHIRVKGSKPYIQPRIEVSNKASETRYVRVKLLRPPAGAMNESISLFYNCDGYDYEVMVPVEGTVKGRYSTSPSIVNLGTIYNVKDANAIVDVFVNDESSNEPLLNVEGDWEIEKVIYEGQSNYRIKLVLRKSALSKYCAGKLLIGGDLGETPLEVPIFATVSKPDSMN